MHRVLMAAVLCLLPVSGHTQSLDAPTPGIPRNPFGKPDLTAPAPPLRDGKPDLSGLWRLTPTPYGLDLIQNLKDETIFKPAAVALFRERAAEYGGPPVRCAPLGPGDIFSREFRIMQSP